MPKLSGPCPECGKGLEIPEELSEFSCMYCGARLRREQLVDDDSQALLETLQEKLPACVTDYRNTVKYLFPEKYEDHYRSYKKECRQVLESINHLPEALHEALAKSLVESIEAWAALYAKNKRGEDSLLEEARFTLCLLMVPALQQVAPWQGKAFSQTLRDVWVEAHPKQMFSVTTYDEIAGGFRKKKLCFITTAVCAYQGKGDDCAELTAFRRFRDGWLMDQPDGRELVQRYYEIAPGIVTAIDLTEPDRVYPALWDTWLKPCYEALQAGQLQTCKRQYTAMVRHLEKKYLEA